MAENKFQIELHSSTNFLLVIAKAVFSLPQVLNQYGSILISDVGKRRFHYSVTLLVICLLCLEGVVWNYPVPIMCGINGLI